MKADPTMLAQLELRDLHAPAPPSIWPPAPGWWLLALLALIITLWAIRIAWRWSRRRRLRRRVMSELDALSAQDADARLAADISALLKRAALRRFPREQVAGLTGADWLEFLDRTGGAGQFSAGPGRVLASGPYAPATSCDAAALSALARRWLDKNL